MITTGIKRKLLQIYYGISSYRKCKLWRGNQKVFVLSMQKTGTTSTGKFFEYFGFPHVNSGLANFRNWNHYWYRNEFEKIWKDPVFINNQIFEDAPFWAKDFYIVLYQKFPNAYFILFTRNCDEWFDSMLKQGKGRVLGDPRFHAKVYKNEEVLQDPYFNITEHRSYYTNFYKQRNQSIIDFFQSKPALFIHLELEDENKWIKLANFLNLRFTDNLDFHHNKSI